MAAVILATGTAERCLACLAMVGRFHGRGVDLNGLRQRFAPRRRLVAGRTGSGRNSGEPSRAVAFIVVQFRRRGRGARLWRELSRGPAERAGASSARACMSSGGCYLV
jgi:hypothetical protein